jgi:hypothetical protein
MRVTRLANGYECKSKLGLKKESGENEISNVALDRQVGRIAASLS